MAKYRRPASTPPRKPENAAELAALVQRYAVKQLDKGDGEAADWPMIAEAMLKVAFDALDKRPDDPRTISLMRRVHSGAENRITRNPAYEQELFKPDTSRELLNTYGFDSPGPHAPKRQA